VAALGIAALFIYPRPQSLMFLSGLLLHAWVMAYYAQPGIDATPGQIHAEFRTGRYERPGYVRYLSLLATFLVLAAIATDIASH
jgi:hypothetical protein